jgi:hypothetical protein
MHAEAEEYISGLSERAQQLALAVHQVFLSLGCTSYVKTIYVGYDIDGQMVSALYGHASSLEVALALPDDTSGPLLEDASHLTWRTLPVAAVIKSTDEIDSFSEHAQRAVERIKAQVHDVERDNDFFIRARRERTQRRSHR